MKYIMILVGGLFLAGSVSAQSLEEVDGSRSNAMERTFAFTSGAEDQYTVRVIGTKGQIILAPIIVKQMSAKEAVRFKLDTQDWKPGIYQVVASSKRGKTVTKRIRIRSRNKG